MPSARELFYRYLGQTSPAPLSLEIESAHGCVLRTSAGREILDFISGIAVSNLGHSHPAIIRAVQEQADRHLHLMVYGEFVQSPQVQLASRLASLLAPSLSNVFFVNSGAEAVEGALKLAKRMTGRPFIVTCNDAYHGSTQGALSVCGNDHLSQAFRPLIPGTRRIAFNDETAFDAIDDSTAAVIIEPIQGEAGIVVPRHGYLSRLRDRCTATGTLLVFDEIQTGFGRTGTLFAFEQENVIPDILLLGKALGGGLPLGAFVASPDLMSGLTHDPVLGHITTFGGHPLSCAAALAALDTMLAGKQIAEVSGKEALLRSLLHHPLIRSIRGKGLFLSIEFSDENTCRRVIASALERGVLTDWFLFAPHCMRLAPPLIITDDEIRSACTQILLAMDEVAAANPSTA